MTSLPPPTTLPSSSDTTITHVLDLLFEPSPLLHDLTLPVLRSTTFPTYPVLVAAVNAQLGALATSQSASDVKKLDEILGAHPRLGAKKVDSPQSAQEQAQLQGNGEEANMLAGLNEEYEKKFPGLRYVVFVDGRSRQIIMQNMRQRIDRGDIGLERQEAIQAMCDIAIDRAAKLEKEG